VGSGITDRGSGSALFWGIRDQALPYLLDQGRKLATLLGSKIRNLRTKMGSAMKKHTSLPPRHYRRIRRKVTLACQNVKVLCSLEGF